MIKLRVLGRPKKLFHGWFVVLGAFISQTLQSGFGFQGFGTFIIPLEQEFGWDKTTLSGARSLMQFENGLMGPVEGAFIDRFGSRITMAFGMFIFGLGLFLLGFIQSLWAYYVVFVIIAFGTSISGFLVLSTAINNWFRRKRTFALSLAQMGLGFGGIALIPLLVWMQGEYGWRTAAIAAGIMVWSIGLPASLLMRRIPEQYGLLPDGDPPSTPFQRTQDVAAGRPTGGGLIDFTLGEALRTRAFWLLGIGHGMSVIAIGGAITHQFAHMELDEGVGLSRATAALVVTVLSAMNIVGRLGAGLTGDRFDKRYLAAAGTGGVAVAMVVLATAGTLWQAMTYAVVLGFFWGIRGPMMSSMRGEYFGRTHFGKIVGTSSLLVMPGSIFGPILAGLMFDIQGDYQLAFILLGAISAFGAISFLLIRPPSPPARLRGSPTAPTDSTVG